MHWCSCFHVEDFKHSPKNKPLNFQLFPLTSNVWNRHFIPILKSLYSLELHPIADPYPWDGKQGLRGCLEWGRVGDGLRMRDGVRLGIIWQTNYMWTEVICLPHLLVSEMTNHWPSTILSKGLAHSLRINVYLKQSAKLTMGILLYIHEWRKLSAYKCYFIILHLNT